MKDRIVSIDKEIEALDKEKKNFARRINYKIKKLKSEKSELLKRIVPEGEFELTCEDNEYDTFIDNKWVNCNFVNFLPGNFIRVRVSGEIKEISGARVFEVVSVPYLNLDKRYSIKVKFPQHTLRDLRAEIKDRLSFVSS